MQVKSSPVVLLVEDDPNFAARLKAAVLLWNADAQIHLHATGQDAVAWISSGTYSANLVLVDLGLPDMEGTKVIEAARRRNAETPILVVSLLTSERLCCTNPSRDSSCESSVIAGCHEQTEHTDLQDAELARV